MSETTPLQEALRPVDAFVVSRPHSAYLIFRNRFAGRRNRYDVLRLGPTAMAVYVGRELTLAHARRICV